MSQAAALRDRVAAVALDPVRAAQLASQLIAAALPRMGSP